MSFGNRWLSWTNCCSSTASFSVLINGTPVGFFQSSRGLRQGDSLSPYLLVIGMEVPSRLIYKALEGSFLFGCKTEGRGEEELIISHLLYVDDATPSPLISW